jgi:hypothetical protein
MAVKKSKPAADSTPKAPATKAAPKTKKAAPKVAKAAIKAVATDTASKAETPKPAPAPAPASKAAAPKAAAAAPKKAPVAIKLTDRQLDFLKQIHGASEDGYLLVKKAEQRTIEALLDRKLIKKGAKDKASGNYRYTVSKAGEKHLSTQHATA